MNEIMNNQSSSAATLRDNAEVAEALGRTYAPASSPRSR